MNRYRAALTHFGLSVLVVGTVFVLVYFLWYPPPLFHGAGGRDLFLVLALVDVTVGPLITLVIFRPGKKALKLDLAVIAVLQLAALAYGTQVVYEARPAWVVFVKDRFDLVRANQVLEESRSKAPPQFQALSRSGPKLAAARLPTDPGDQFQMAMSAMMGLDVSSYPHYFVPYAEVRAEVLAKKRTIGELRELNPGESARIDALLRRLGRDDRSAAFLPLRAGKQDLAVLIDAATGDYLGISHLRPWNM